MNKNKFSKQITIPFRELFLLLITVSILWVFSATLYAAAPSVQAKNVTYTNVTSDQLSVSWTRGNGSYCAVFMIHSNTSKPSPANNKTYPADTVFGNGTEVGTSGWYCIYNGTGTSVNVSGLNPAATYRVMVCEYNGSPGAEAYNINSVSTNPLNVVTLKADQYITFDVLNDVTYGDADFDPGAYTSSGLSVTYTSDNTSVATIVSGKVHIVGAGNVHITASQPGNTQYNAAVSVTQPLTINKGSQTISFLTLSGKLYGDADFDPGASSNSGLSITYSSDNTSVVSIVSGMAHIVAPGTVNLTASQAGNSNYYPAANVSRVLTVYPDTQSVAFNPLPVMTYGDADYTPSATSTSGLPVTFSSTNTAVATIVSGKIHIVQPGTVTIVASQPGNPYYAAATDQTQSLTINKASQSLTFPAIPAKVYGGADFDPGATSNRGLTVTYSSDNQTVATVLNGKIHIVAAGTANITASQAGNAYYDSAANITQVLTVNKADQAITFNSLPAKSYGDADFDPGATASSSLTVSYSSDDTLVATITGGMIHIKNAGTTHITATQNGNGNYNAAASVTQTLTVAKASQTLTFPAMPVKYYGDTDFDPNAFASTGYPVTYYSDNPNVASILNGKVHIVGAGSAHITASQAGDSNYGAVSVSQLLTVNKEPQTITFNTLPSKSYGSSDFDPGAISGSGLSVSYSSDNTAVATIVNGKIHIVGAGTADILANQAGNVNYAAASQVVQLLTVSKASQTIYFNGLPAKTYGNADFYPVASASSGLPVSFSSDNSSVATIVNGQIHITGAGTATITALQQGNTNYNAAPNASQILVVNKAGQSIIFTTLPLKTYGDAVFSPGAFTTSGLSVSYTSDNNSVAVIRNDSILIMGAGTAHITALQNGNTNYNAAVSVTQLLTVSKASQFITFNAIPAKTYGDNDFDPGAVSNSGLAISYTSSNTSIAEVINGKVHITGVGSVTLTASQPGNVNYNAAFNNPSQKLVVQKALLTVTADSVSRPYGTPNPVFTCWYSGFVNDDDITSLAVIPVVTTSATIISLPGQYDLVPQGGSDPHYNFVYVNGILTIYSSTPSQPSMPSGNTSVCENSGPQTYTTGGSSRATSYQWGLTPSSAGTVSGDSSSVSVTFNSNFAGTCAITVAGVNPSETGPVSDTLYVNVVALPSSPEVSMRGTYCGNEVGDSIFILHSQTGYVYQLNMDMSMIDSPLPGDGSDIGWYGIKAGTYYITENVCHDTVAKNLNVKEVINNSAKPGIAMKWDDVVICESSGDSVKSYQWFKNDSLMSGEANQYIWTQKQQGYYSVRTIDLNGCISEMSDQVFVQAALGSVYPNPAHGLIHVAFTNFNDGKVRVRIYNSFSLPIKDLFFTKQGESFEQDIDISQMNVGVYFIEILLNGKRILFNKLLVE